MFWYIGVLPFIIICLFILYLLSKNDSVLLRKNIGLTSMFNIAFISLVCSFILGRLFYIMDTYRFSFLYPVEFFHVIKFPGLSVFGLFLGGILVYALYYRKKTIGRVLDISSLAFFPLLLVYQILFPFVHLYLLIRVVILLVILILFFVILYSHKNYYLKDGSIFFVMLITFSVFNFVSLFYSKYTVFLLYFSFSQIISAIVIVIGVVLLAKNESIIRYGS